MRDKLIIITIIFLGLLIGVGVYYLINREVEENLAFEREHPCVEWGEEEYYDSSYTGLAISTKNYGLMALNGYKTREICIKRN